MKKNSQNNDPDFNDLNFDMDFGNFNPDEIEVDETINAVFVVDTSTSITSYVQDLNQAFNDFVETMQKSHIAEKLFVSIVEFNTGVEIKTGFQPIANISHIDFSRKIKGVTSLYDGVFAALKNAVDYRENLENSGVETKTLIFVITDGDDNHSKNPPHVVKQLIDKLKHDERSALSFTSILFGVGNAAGFEQARTDMGIEHLARVGTTGKDMRNMIGFVSQSISSISAGKAAPPPDF